MVNKSSKCYSQSCGKNGKIPIYYRDEERIFKVAFYVCKYCMRFSGFINWATHRSMPYFNDMWGLIRMRFVRNFKDKETDKLTRRNRVLLMQKDPYQPCIKCKKYDYSKLFTRNRDKGSFDFVGYVCKNCKVAYFIKTPNLEFRTLDPKGYYNDDGSLPNFHDIPFNEYMGQSATAIGEDEEKPPLEEVTITIKKLDILKLKKSKIKFKYAN